MTRDLPENMAILRSAFGDGPLYVADGEFSIEVDGVEFVCDYQPGSTAERFYLLKNPEAVGDFTDRARAHAGGVVVELGVAEGGSVALLALTARPRTLLAFELETRPVPALDDFIADRGLEQSVRVHFGVDQSDRARLTELVAEELGDEPIDLVIDDASHRPGPTRTSFEVLFPLLRTGGLYVIEDWSADLRFRSAVVRSLRNADEATKASLRRQMAEGASETTDPTRPLSDLAVELLLARAQQGDAIRDVTLGRFEVQVRRGADPLDPDSFRLADLFDDHYGYLR